MVVNEAFLPLLYDAILKLPARADVRPCSKCPLTLVQEGGRRVVAMVERTFINTEARPRRGSGHRAQRPGRQPGGVGPSATSG